MNPLLQFLSLAFGLMPFNRSNPKSNIFLDYSCMALVPIFYFTCYFTVNFYAYGLYSLPTCNSICRLGNRLFMHLGCFLYVSIYFLTLVRRKSFFLEFDQKLIEIDSLIEKCAKVADDKLKLPQKWQVYYFTWAFVLAIFAFDVFFDVKEAYVYLGKDLYFSVMVITFPFIVGSIVQGMFIYYVSVIAHRFREINSLFNRINMENDRKNAPIAVFDIENDVKKDKKMGADTEVFNAKMVKAKSTDNANLKVDSNNEHDSNNESDDAYQLDDEDEEQYGPKTHTNDGRTSESNLPDLFKLHDKILSLSVIVNAEFGAQCVPYMAVCFAITIFGIFLETKVIFIVGGQNDMMDYVIFIYVYWSFTTMMVGYLVLRLCCNTNAYSKESAMIVHEIMQKKPSFMLGNDLYYNKMKAFTLQFLHWEGYFQFNGIGLFALDYTFIFSTVSAATSYLIVLLQFDMSSILKSEGLNPSAVTQSEPIAN